ncbi:cell division protein FtsK [Amycolatopsis acidiphila]|uniref:Cell division protein FtsK n=1 Tax=Amycolatopsis acidiphila TaxID=715473 RepID=A0A557ZZG3_9PSEU|nr:FtsK/SpoIIIE domain-containing protein [Amycolatopsis acidiphila]TVT17387.1 cell division protein FtsK [Amycolatopsis acidiphila]UIJ59856.1 cell division protein FtsK [Amycolatopsis acidiphila]GHG62778.1 cell division protein FtsK [Amycolatopsis acidiphila]
MSAHTFGVLFLGGVGLAVVVWVLHKLGRALASIAEALAATAVVFIALWSLIRAFVWVVKEIVTHPRTSLTVVAVASWCLWLGWLSLVVTATVVTAGLLSWRRFHLVSFDQWAGGPLRSWWFRWAVYMPKLPGWLHACGLSVKDDTVPVDVTVTLVGCKKINRDQQESRVHVPRVRRVKSGASWDEVRVVLVPGQKPEDFDEAARALASARKVSRCQVREVGPNVVSLDFQRRDLLAAPVQCPPLDEGRVDLRRVWAGRTEYGQDWHLPLYGSGSHTLVAGASGAGKNSVMWCPLVSIAPAIRDGLVRVSGIDPKGMELAYGRDIFHRYAVTPADALEVLNDLVTAMDTRKREFAGRVRAVPVSTDNPLELVEFDEIGALTKYTDRKTREAIIEKVALLTTQGRALGFTVRGYVQEPTKETVPVRELFPRRICLRVTAKSHVGMVLGDQAYERGAWANRIGESEAGTGYVWGEGIREPLRVRAGWVPDETVKALEAFVAGGSVVSLPGFEGGVAA